MDTIRFAFRSLCKAPAFSLVVIAALALGIGANSAIFSIIDAIFLRPLPYVHPAQILQLTSVEAERAGAPEPFSFPRMLAVRERQQVFSDLSLSTPTAFTVSGRGDPEQVRGMIVSANYFPLLGVEPLQGRGFLPDEDRAGGAAVVMLSYGYWQQHYAAQADAIGRSITLDGKPHTIIGVMPKSISGFPIAPAALFTTRPDEASFLTPQQVDGGGLFYTVLARLRPGVDLRQARAAMDVIASGYAHAHPTNADVKSRIHVGLLQDDLVGGQRQTYAMLFAAVAAVLLIACANVANLVLARFSRRRKEIGIRFALGARRIHVVLPFLAENMLLAIGGGLLGLLLAAASLPLLAQLGEDFIPRAEEISLNPSVVAFTLGVSVLVGLTLGVIPAMQASMHAVNDSLKDSSRESTADRSRSRIRSGLLIGQIAVSVVLLIVTSLLISSFVHIHNVSPGFRAEGVFSGFLVVPPAQYPPRTEATANFYSRLYHRLQAIPGARSVALSDDPPLSGNDGQSPYAVVGRPLPPMSERPLAIRHLISPNRFGVLGIPFKAGRDFSEHDTSSSPPVVIISAAMAKQLFPGGNPLGQKLVTGMMQMTAEIVGVVADVHTTSLAAPPEPEMFYPVMQRPENFIGILIRTDGDPAALTASVRAALHDVDAGIPLVGAGTMQDFVNRSMADRQLTMILLVVFAGLALLLSSLGVYSVMAYSVTQRAGEIGIRMALGAQSADVQKMVVGQGMKHALVGVAIGVMAALALTRLMRALLFDVSASDPATYIAITLLLFAVAAVACWLPARRAARVDPVTALHDA
ncbi:MAG: ABC transporter permease [Dokdonella sp.]